MQGRIAQPQGVRQLCLSLQSWSALTMLVLMMWQPRVGSSPVPAGVPSGSHGQLFEFDPKLPCVCDGRFLADN